jgi:hypothetical protein
MFNRSPSLRIKQRKPNGTFFEIEISASLFRWVLWSIVVITLLIRGADSDKVLRLITSSVLTGKPQTIPMISSTERLQ